MRGNTLLLCMLISHVAIGENYRSKRQNLIFGWREGGHVFKSVDMNLSSRNRSAGRRRARSPQGPGAGGGPRLHDTRARRPRMPATRRGPGRSGRARPSHAPRRESHVAQGGQSGRRQPRATSVWKLFGAQRPLSRRRGPGDTGWDWGASVNRNVGH